MNSPAGIFAYFARGLITRPSGIQSRLPPYRGGLGCCFDNDLLRFFATSNSSPALPRKTLTHARSSLTDDIAGSFPLGLYIPSLLSSSCSVIIITKQKEGEKRRSFPKRFERDNNKNEIQRNSVGFILYGKHDRKISLGPFVGGKSRIYQLTRLVKIFTGGDFFPAEIKSRGSQRRIYNDAYIYIII